MSTPYWEPLAASPSIPLPVVNGQWIKGVGGAAVWAPITSADVSGIGARTSTLLDSGASFDVAWAGAGAHTLIDEVNPTATFSHIRRYGAPPAGTGTRLVLRSGGGNAFGITHNSSTGTGVPLFCARGVGRQLAPGEVSEFIYEAQYPLWIEINYDEIVSYGTSLPLGTADGMEAVLVDSLTNPSYQWRFRYNAGSTSAYKWECIGGDDVWKVAQAGAYSALATGFNPYAPIFNTPRAGDWDVSAGAQFTSNPTANALLQMAVGTTAPGLATAHTTAIATGHSTIVVNDVLINVPSGQQISHWEYAGSADCSSANRWMRVRPRRVA